MLCEYESTRLVVEKSIDNKKCHNVKYEMINNFFQRLNIWTRFIHVHTLFVFPILTI